MADQPTETVFSNEAPEQTPVTETPAQEVKTEQAPLVTDPYADLLKDIVREDGTQKYASIPDVIKATKASQEYIAKLEAEAAETKAELKKRMAAEEVLEQLKATKTEETTPSESLDLSQLEAMVEGKITSTLTAAEQQRAQKDNVSTVITAMSQKFGDKAEEQFIQAATEAGLSIEAFNQLSATSPKAVLKLVGLDNKQQGSPAATSGSINTEALQPSEHKLSAKVPAGANTKAMVGAWRAAGQS